MGFIKIILLLAKMLMVGTQDLSPLSYFLAKSADLHLHNIMFMFVFWFSDWLERILQETKPTPKLVTVVNPGNPSGTYIPEAVLKV